LLDWQAIPSFFDILLDESTHLLDEKWLEKQIDYFGDLRRMKYIIPFVGCAQREQTLHLNRIR